MMEFVPRRGLSKNKESISGIVLGNPKMKTAGPTAERLFAPFDNLHLLIQEHKKKISGVMVEELTAIQNKNPCDSETAGINI